MDTMGSRSIPCSCSMLWHRARFWEQSSLQGPLGTGCVQGCAALTGATSYIPTRALEMGAPQDQGHQERWKSLWKGLGEEAAAQEHRGLQVPAREQIQCAGCWLWGRAGCCVPRLALGFGQRSWDMLGDGAGCRMLALHRCS